VTLADVIAWGIGALAAYGVIAFAIVRSLREDSP
jgi:hypothetical protein